MLSTHTDQTIVRHRVPRRILYFLGLLSLVFMPSLITATPETLDSQYRPGRTGQVLHTMPITTETAYLTTSNSEQGDGVGENVLLSNGLLVVSAPSEASNGSGPDNNSEAGAGAVFVFEQDQGQWVERAYLKASNAEQADFFGEALAIDGDTLVIGAWAEDGDGSSSDNNNGSDTGAAYVFVRNPETDTWSQQGYLKGLPVATYDTFGNAVAISGDTIAVGAPYKNVNFGDAGAVYVFVRDPQTATWSQQALLKADNADFADHFGMTVAMEGDTLVVGALGEDSNGSSPEDNTASDAGAVYVFVRDPQTATWSQQAYLKAHNADAEDRFGSAIAIERETIIVGATFVSGSVTDPNDPSAGSSGAAYVFVRDPQTATWSQQGYLKAHNAATRDNFGTAVAISGDTVVVGASENFSYDTGQAYVFTRHEGVWHQWAHLQASNPEIHNFFGHSVAIDGHTVVVGAINAQVPNPDDQTIIYGGAAFIFDLYPSRVYLPSVFR